MSGRASVIVVGAGPAGLAAAETAAAGGAAVTVFERMPTPARKFLLAGRGGLNLTHTEPLEAFVARYGGAAPALRPALEAFSPAALRAWSESLGEPTFVGTSGRVFPRSFKATPLLRAWLRRLAERDVVLRPRHRWTGWTPDGALAFDTPEGARTATADAVILALGGASWPRLGSDGGWTAPLEAAGYALATLRPSNCGFAVAWSDGFRARFEGHPLTGIAVHFGGRAVRGEAVITKAGIEGGPVYALSAALRDTVAAEGRARVHLALRPESSEEDLRARLARAVPKQSTATILRKTLKLSPVAIGLVNEVRRAHPGLPLAALVHRLPLDLIAPAPLADAISTAGGLAFAELDGAFMLRRHPGLFAAGEMLDWEAPTGGYLLQASFATGVAAGRGALRHLGLERAAGA